MLLYGNIVNYQNVAYIQQQSKEEDEILISYTDYNALCIFDADWKATELTTRAIKMKNIYLTDQKSLKEKNEDELKMLFKIEGGV